MVVVVEGIQTMGTDVGGEDCDKFLSANNKNNSIYYPGTHCNL